MESNWNKDMKTTKSEERVKKVGQSVGCLIPLFSKKSKSGKCNGRQVEIRYRSSEVKKKCKGVYRVTI